MKKTCCSRIKGHWTFIMTCLFLLGQMKTTTVVASDIVFGEATKVGPMVNSNRGEFDVTYSTDGREIYFTSNRHRSEGLDDFDIDIYMTTWNDADGAWTIPVNLGPTINSSSWDEDPFLTSDGLTLYFDSYRSEIWFGDLWMTTRETKDDDWGPPVNLGPTVNSQGRTDEDPSLTADGLELYFSSDRSGAYWEYNLWVARRATIHDPWNQPVKLSPTVNGPNDEMSPTISSDGLILIFNRNDPARDTIDLWMTRRASREEDWGQPERLGPTVNIMRFNPCPDISPDGRWLRWCSVNEFSGVDAYDIWQAPIIPSVDFNGDFQVDIEDLIVLIEHWGQNKPAYDMGPMPWGDGVIDVADLEVLMSYWGQELDDPHLIAHWKLDETEGTFAVDSVSGNNGLVFGNPIWQPEDGQVQGALEFDGINDMIMAKFVLNPEEGPFSVFAWIRGGEPGQVIISQQGATDWLLVDADGTLMTDLKNAGKSPIPLNSETVITDGNWHRVGFVWDGSQRILYVDDVQVATDNQSSLSGSAGGLTIGVGKNNLPGTFWSGMIDEVRVYDRVVVP